jgi:MoxR-like ATPase
MRPSTTRDVTLRDVGDTTTDRIAAARGVDVTPPESPDPVESALLEDDLATLASARTALGKVVVGQTDIIDELLVCVIAGGHALVEGAPGLGKTLLVRSLAEVAGLSFSRIQFTPDLMPADITGTLALVYDAEGRPTTRFQPGPIFGQLVLADEINRATPKTQSALLEAMQERTVTVAGTEYPMQRPFYVFATQNPFEMEGTYTLPEAQIDRFFYKVVIEYPSEAVLDAILAQTTGTGQVEPEQTMTPDDILRLQRRVREVPIAEHVRRGVVRFVRSTLPTETGADERVRRYVRFGVSPRGAQALVLAAKAHALVDGRYAVSLEDVRAAVLPALRHRFQLNFEGVADGVDTDALLLDLFESTATRSVAA